MKVLLSTDGSEFSEAAVEALKNFRFPAGSEIRIISVLDMSVELSLDENAGRLKSAAEIENAAREKIRKILSETKGKIAAYVSSEDVTINTELLDGDPKSRIIEKALEMSADLIVIGSHGYNSWERFLLGSVSDSVVRHAQCSVLLVRKRENRIS
jgi:Universal stress protein UspA and related nucleotide-binding proteins